MKVSRPLSVLVAALVGMLAFAAALTFADDPAQAPLLTAAPTSSTTPAATPTPTPSVAPAPTATPAISDGLAVGITEPNANLVAAPGVFDVPQPWAQWRDALGAIHPAYYRLMLDWAALQPSADAPPNLAAPDAGCMRATQPCLGWGGVLDQLRALASRQQEGGWQGVVVITDTPAWAAVPASGCERAGTAARSRPPRADALGAYQQLVAAVLAAAAQTGAQLTYWSPWNEPNHPYFLSPQRADCSAASPTLAPAGYAALATALGQELAAAPGDQQLVLGDTAGLLKPTAQSSSVQEFIAALPQDVVCASSIWAQHAYVGGPDPVDAVATALAARGCPHPYTIWITETGVGTAPSYLSGARAIADQQKGCAALHARLTRWYDDPRVSAAFQYTLRADDQFPTGLVSTDLSAARPTLAEWTAWGGTRAANAPAPAQTCGAGA